MVELAAFRRPTLRIFLALLVATGLVASISVLTGEFTALQLKMIGSSLSAAAACVCTMACGAFASRYRMPAFGWAGLCTALVSALMLIYGIWSESKSWFYWRVTGTLITFTIAFTHALVLWMPSLERRFMWLRRAGSYVIASLAVSIFAVTWLEISGDIMLRLISANSIIVAGVTLAIPLLSRLKLTVTKQKEGLVLTHMKQNRYKDGNGFIYEVRRVEDDDVERSSGG